MAKSKARSSSVSKKLKPITKTAISKTITNGTANSTGKRHIPKTLKPLRARQLIRRFHVLLKYKSSVLKKFVEINNWDNVKDGKEVETKYLQYIESRKKLHKIYKSSYEKTWNELKINKTPASVVDPTRNDKIDNSLKLNELVEILGRIDAEIEKRGGLETYQTASTLGQDGKRGGDSSKILVKWLQELNWKGEGALEIGCLSSKNEISKCGIFKEIKRLDLHSQEPGIIEEQDFLERPIPHSENDRSNCVSCSLVVNFVPSPELRGKMMVRMCNFLKNPTKDVGENFENYSILFFVLPLPCIQNSRYFNLDKMNEIWQNLGFEQLQYHESSKLAYWLMKWKGDKYINKEFVLKKQEVRKGNDRNNFCIVIK